MWLNVSDIYSIWNLFLLCLFRTEEELLEGEQGDEDSHEEEQSEHAEEKDHGKYRKLHRSSG